MNLFLVLFALVSTAVSAHKSGAVRGSDSGTYAPRQRFPKKKTNKSSKHSSSNDSSPDDDSDNEYFLTAEIGMYPGSSNEFADIEGTVNLRFNPDDGTFLTKLNLSGLLKECTNCGAHVHEGTSCDDASAPGGHFWNKELLGDMPKYDPWNFVSYNATDDGTTTTGFYMDTGLGLQENDGHAVVIHIAGGARVGCGVLKMKKVESEDIKSLVEKDVGPYPGYTGELKPEGSVQLDVFPDSSLKFAFAMSGLAPNCIHCGVHVHAGLTCDNASLVLGHYWDKTEQVEDPWVASFGAVYNTNEDGDATSFFYLFSGYDFMENENHAIVFHAQDGARVACGVLKAR